MDRKIDLERQESQYTFPYHYIPYFVYKNEISIIRKLSWGLDYLSSLSYILELIKSLRIKSLLDVGCGDGRLINLVCPFVQTVMGYDTSDQAIRFAKAFNPDVKYYSGDLNEIKMNFDCISLIQTLEHIPENDIKQLNDNLDRIVFPKGYLIISVPTTNVPVSRKHYRHYDLALLKKHVSSKFRLIRVNYILKISLRSKIMKYIMINRFFILNYSPLMRILYKQHSKHLLNADERNSRHLVAIFQKK